LRVSVFEGSLEQGEVEGQLRRFLIGHATFDYKLVALARRFGFATEPHLRWLFLTCKIRLYISAPETCPETGFSTPYFYLKLPPRAFSFVHAIVMVLRIQSWK
jgi:hypothetical protein